MTTTASQVHTKPTRVVSLDVLRGATVAFMILVNTAGDGAVSYAQLRHSVWNGCTLTDLVFPTFLFVMGASMALSMGARQQAQPRLVRLRKITRRSVILVALGLALNALPLLSPATLRFCGVMQRIGVTYWLAATCALWLGDAGLAALAAALLLGYWALLTVVPVPGYGLTGLQLGVLKPAANVANALDRAVIPRAHLYHFSFYDPEGLLSTLPALASVLLGLVTGKHFRSPSRRLGSIAAMGAALAATGFAWSTVFPLNKRLWTSSFVLWVAGLDMLLWAGLSLWLDRRQGAQPRPWLRPFLAFGSNALAAYVLSELLAILISVIHVPHGFTLQRWSFLLLPGWLGPPAFRSLLWSIAFTLLCFLPIAQLYRKRILIKL